MESHNTYYNRKIINIPIYRGKLVLIFSNDLDKVKKIPYFEGSENYAKCIRSYLGTWEAVYIIINFNAKTPITHGVLTHETIHAANFILEGRGILSDYNNDEPLCYLAEWINNEIYTFMKEKKFEI